MSHATAFAQPRNPSNDGDALSSAIEHAREAIARPDSDNDDGDTAEPLPPSSTFFRHLDAHSRHGGSDCLSWRGGPFRDHASAERMARADRAIAGLEGVLAVMHAADLAAHSGEVEPTFSPYLLDRLMFAARALTDGARDTIEGLREQARSDR